jgi:mRNA interferase RelE/StbE
MYRLLFHPNVEKQLSKIPRPFAQRLSQAIRELRNDPRPAPAKHLDQEMYRLREGDYRIVYAIFDQDQVVYVGRWNAGLKKRIGTLRKFSSGRAKS